MAIIDASRKGWTTPGKMVITSIRNGTHLQPEA
jgi:hypothetical protein